MKTKSLLLALFSLFFSELVIAQQPDPVMTDCGLIQGMFENGLTVYKGVPFLYGDFGTFQAPEDYHIDWDIKKAYTIDGNVDAYVGFTQGFEFEDMSCPETQQWWNYY